MPYLVWQVYTDAITCRAQGSPELWPQQAWEPKTCKLSTPKPQTLNLNHNKAKAPGGRLKEAAKGHPVRVVTGQVALRA